MRRTLFEAGFNSPTHAYGIVRPGMGSIWTDIKDMFKPSPAKPPTTVSMPPPPVPQPSGTVLGIPTSYVLIGGAVALTLGIVAALVGAKKPKGPAPVPPKVAGRRHR